MNELEAAMQCLQHMLGADSRYPKRQWGFRNYFDAGGKDQRSMDLLLEAGYVLRGRANYYHATIKGCRLLGFGKPAIKRALE